MIFTIFPSLLFNPKSHQTAPSLKAPIPQTFFQNSSTFLEKKIGKVLFDERFSSHDNLILFQMIF
jgi:hypothetical protein